MLTTPRVTGDLWGVLIGRESVSETDCLTFVVATLAGRCTVLLTAHAVIAILEVFLRQGDEKWCILPLPWYQRSGRARGVSRVETQCCFKCFSDGGWNLGALNEAAQNVSPSLLMGVYVPH